MRGSYVKKILVVMSIALALVLTGCSRMDTAASVGSAEITLKELQAQIDSIIAERGKVDTSQMQLETGEALTRSHLSFMISNLLVDQIAADKKIEVTKADIDAYKSEIYTNIGGEANLPSVLVNAAIPPMGLDAVLRRDLILRKITEELQASGADDAAVNTAIQKLVSDKATEAKVVVNPRYGTWDPTSFTVVAAEPAGNAVTTK